ncbi:uncharacterized protein JCM6883_000552 [Sporobolomyces salmoneus]|uniref:uncharacterized protein n=1 Tax=Sporobolomyces salmoneus TaxID=183962 RepID=UPI003170DDBB
MAPQLPPEIISMILEYALPPATIPSSALDVHFSRTRSQVDDKSLSTFVSAAGRNWLGFARNMLWHDVHVGSTRRAEKLIEALSLALPRTPESKGYLVPLVHRLEFDIRERPLQEVQLQGSTKAHLDGVLPVQIAQLATLLPRLDSLSINVSVPGGWLSQTSIVESFVRFVGRPEFRHLEITSTGLGFRNALSIFSESPKLETLKLRGLQPRWTFLTSTGGMVRASEFTNRPKPAIPYPFSSTLTKLVLWECRMDTQEFVDLCSSLSAVKTLVIHLLGTEFLGFTTTLPSTSSILVTSLAPLIGQLEHFHLVLPLSAANSPPPFPLDALSTHFSSSLKSLILGGPSLFSLPTFFNNLINLDTGFLPRSITFTQCTFSQRDARSPSHGLKAQDLVKALDENWTTSLEVLDVEGMTDENEGEAAGEKYWDSNEVEKLRDKVREVNESRKEEGKKELVLRYDEALEEREREAREWEERRRGRNRGGRGRARGGGRR